jgi:tetratricopeptide (TPR) repeat protein
VLLPDYRGANIERSNIRAIQIVEQGITADSAIEAAAAAVFGFVYHKQKKWTEAEAAFTKATNASVVEPNAFNWYSLMLGSVGRFDEALEQGLAGLEIFPDSAVLNSRVAIVYAWIGNTQKAGEFFERARQLGVGGGTHSLAEAIYLFGQGEFAEAQRAASSGVADGGGTTTWVGPVFAAFEDPANRDAALASLDTAAQQDQVNPQVEATVRMLLGDTDGALRVTRELVQPGETYETEFLFLQQFRPLRERSEFLELMNTLGITEYWQKAGCEWVNLAVDCS